MPTDEEPLPSSQALATSDEGDAGPEPEPESAPAPAAPKRSGPPPPTFKFSTMLYAFTGMLGLLMLIDTPFRNQIACALGTYSTTVPGQVVSCSTGWGPLYAAIGFGSVYILATMAVAGALEMLFTALAYNYTTDWIKAAKVQKWSAAFRKVQMEAIRSGKKDRIAALKPFQERLTRLSSEVSIAQFKGLAITWFLLILIYTWIGLVIENAGAHQIVDLGGTLINIYTFRVGGYFPLWFFVFSLFTVPLSLAFRRILKNYWLRRYMERRTPTPSASATDAAGGSA